MSGHQAVLSTLEKYKLDRLSLWGGQFNNMSLDIPSFNVGFILKSPEPFKEEYVITTSYM